MVPENVTPLLNLALVPFIWKTMGLLDSHLCDIYEHKHCQLKTFALAQETTLTNYDVINPWQRILKALIGNCHPLEHDAYTFMLCDLFNPHNTKVILR